MLINSVLSGLLKEGTVLDHKLIEVEGIYTTVCQLETCNLVGKLVRISKHLYMNGNALTIGSPDWCDLGINNSSLVVDKPKRKK